MEKAGKWRFIDKTGKFAIEPRFAHSPSFLYWKNSFSGGVALIEADGPYFELIDRTGNVIKKVEATRVHPFRDELALIELPRREPCGNSEFSFINTAGEFTFPQTFCRATDFSGGLAAVKLDLRDPRWCYIDHPAAS